MIWISSIHTLLRKFTKWIFSAELTAKTWRVEYRGHQIKVVNTWFHGAFLFVDEECVVVNDDTVALPNSLCMTFDLKLDDGKIAKIEVYFHAVVTVKARITANGEKIGGDY